MPAYYGPAKCFGSPEELQQFLAAERSAPSGVTAIRFGADFAVRDNHVKELVEVMGAGLRSIYLGSSDTGNGSWLTDAAALAIVRGCPKLRELALCSCTKITDSAFVAIAEGLVDLEVLHCSGNDKVPGALKDKALTPLQNGKLPRLRELYIADQWGIGFEKVEGLMKKRRSLKVQAGETDSDSAAWGMVLSAQGRGYGDGLYGRW